MPDARLNGVGREIHRGTHMSPATTVIVPTVGRLEMLGQTLATLAEGAVSPREVLIVDQSEAHGVEDLCAKMDSLPLRVLPSKRRGVGHAMNIGLAAASNDCVMVTHDDCRLPPNWVEVGQALFEAEGPDAIVTGRVLPPEGAGYVPSTIESATPREYRSPRFGILYPNNMVVDRDTARTLPFDERRGLLVAEDNDFCFRWLRAGNRIVYRPDLYVWHHDWRSPEELVRTHKRYAYSQGVLYAKHLSLPGQKRVLLSLLRKDLRYGLDGLRSQISRSSERHVDPRHDFLLGFCRGIIGGTYELLRLGRTQAWLYDDHAIPREIGEVGG